MNPYPYISLEFTEQGKQITRATKEEGGERNFSAKNCLSVNQLSLGNVEAA